ncbi:hypothetical protein V5799_003607 [Amblyomma americanum]|uniref:Uncharacterized protein n=1 Tax=Amblyomma americanum TaxID=6943 RepID=A0AAQ4D8G3_AMBAM
MHITTRHHPNIWRELDSTRKLPAKLSFTSLSYFYTEIDVCGTVMSGWWLLGGGCEAVCGVRNTLCNDLTTQSHSARYYW